MQIPQDRKYTINRVRFLLDNAIGKTLGEIDKKGSNQFARTESNKKITGIAGDVIEQSLFGYERDSLQECDIEIDGHKVEIKTTGVRIPKGDLKYARNKSWEEYSLYYRAKEGISITGVTLEPDIQRDFFNSHFWEKAERLLFVFYEYKSYEVVPAAEYKDFFIVGWNFNIFSEEEKLQLKSDWEIVRDYLNPFYNKYKGNERREKLEGFTHIVRPQLLLIELVPGYKRKNNGSYQNPRYRLKKTFVDYLIKGYFDKSRQNKEIALGKSFSSFSELDEICHEITQQYGGKSLLELKRLLDIELNVDIKNFTSVCIIKMFGAEGTRLNDISEFVKAGILAKTITLTPTGSRTEDMKLSKVDFEEWCDRDIDFEDSNVFNYFCEHSFLCPIFCEKDKENSSDTIFLGFKRFSFDDNFIYTDVKRMWKDSRHLIHTNKLEWEYEFNSQGLPIKNKSGSFKGAPNLPKSNDYNVFFRGGANDSSEKSRTEIINGIRMLPQYFWLKGTYISEKLKNLPYL